MRLAIVILLSTPVFAGIILTPPLEEVVAHSSHVALVKWLPDKRRFRVERPYRGAWPDVEFELHGVPGLVSSLHWLSLGKKIRIDGPFGRDPKETLSPSLIVFAETLDGRLYLTGMGRYGKCFGAHASVRMLTTEGSVFRFFQAMNPGPPVPFGAEAPTLEEFEKGLTKILEKHPFQPRPGERPPIPPEHRASFFRAIGDTFDWYQGGPKYDLPGWGVRRTPKAKLEETADRIEAWMDSVPMEARIHGLDALMILCRKVQGGSADTRAIQRRIYARVKEADRAQAEAWILRELRHGGYYVNRVALGESANKLGPDVWIKARGVLEEAIERSGTSVGSASYRALRDLGDKERAEKARKRREAREAKQSDG